MPVGCLDLLAFLLDLAEEPCVLNRECGLSREGLKEVHDFHGKIARILPPDQIDIRAAREWAARESLYIPVLLECSLPGLARARLPFVPWRLVPGGPGSFEAPELSP